LLKAKDLTLKAKDLIFKAKDSKFVLEDISRPRTTTLVDIPRFFLFAKWQSHVVNVEDISGWYHSGKTTVIYL